MPDPCSYLTTNGSALPPNMTQPVPAGSIQTAGAPPAWQRRISFTNFDTIKVIANTDGATLASVYPAAKLVASYTFPVPSGIFLFSLAVSLTVSAAGIGAVYCVKSNSNNLNFTTGPSPLSIFDVVSQQNSLVGVPAPVVRNLQLPLGDGTAMPFNPGDKLGIYMAAPNDANTLLTALLTAYYITMTA